MIDDYFEKIEKTILEFRYLLKSSSIFKKSYNSKQGYIKGDVVFINDSRLCFIEVKNTEVKQKNKYRYHYMDKNESLIFRYDNASHHMEIKTFPHHKHTDDSIMESHELDLYDILIEVQKLINLEAKRKG
jgi:hypothetical protein